MADSGTVRQVHIHTHQEGKSAKTTQILEDLYFVHLDRLDTLQSTKWCRRHTGTMKREEEMKNCGQGRKLHC